MKDFKNSLRVYVSTVLSVFSALESKSLKLRPPSEGDTKIFLKMELKRI